MTNGDRIRSMTNIELARHLATIGSCKRCVYDLNDNNCIGRKCIDGILLWLESEADIDG